MTNGVARRPRQGETIGIGVGAGLLPVTFNVVVELMVPPRGLHFLDAEFFTLALLMTGIGVFFAWISRGQFSITQLPSHFAVAAATPALLVSTISGVQHTICQYERADLIDRLRPAGDASLLIQERGSTLSQLFAATTTFASEQLPEEQENGAPEELQENEAPEVLRFRTPEPTFLQRLLGLRLQLRGYVVQVGDAQDELQAAIQIQETNIPRTPEDMSINVFEHNNRYIVTVGDQTTLPEAVRLLQLANDVDIPDATLRKIPVFD